MQTHSILPWEHQKAVRRPAQCAVWLVLWILSAFSAEAALDTVRVIATGPACFEYLFTGVVSETDGQPLLSFNHRNGRTSFVKPGEFLGPFRVLSLEAKTNHVYNPSLNAYLDQPAGKVTLIGPGNSCIILEQDRRLLQPGRVAWLIDLDNGLWWHVQEQDVFFTGNQPVFVEEVDEDGVMVTAGPDLLCIRRISSGEKSDLNRLWAEQKRQEQAAQELALACQREATRPKAATGSDDGASYFTYERGPHVEIQGPSRFFYGCDYRFPAAFKAYPCAQYVNGQFVPSYVVLPTLFQTRYSGVSVIGP